MEATATPNELGTAAVPLIAGVIWGFWVVADSAQFSAIVTESCDPRYVGTALTLQLAAGFVLTVFTIFLVPIVRDGAGREPPTARAVYVAFIAAFAIAGLAQPAMADDGDWMSVERIRAELIGRTLEMRRMGMTMALTFAEDGTTRAESPVFSVDGTWTLEGNALCVTSDSGPMKGERCSRYRALGDTRYENEQGRTLTLAEGEG